MTKKTQAAVNRVATAASKDIKEAAGTIEIPVRLS